MTRYFTLGYVFSLIACCSACTPCPSSQNSYVLCGAIREPEQLIDQPPQELPAIFIISSQESTERGAAAIENRDEGIAPAISEERFSIDTLRSRSIPDEIMKIAELPLAKSHSIPIVSKSKQVPKQSVLVIIDPGHGGEDLGAKSKVRPIYSEKNFNLVTAKFLQDHLKQMGFNTILTRSKDTFVSLEKRAATGVNPRTEIFVSIHYNAAEAPEAHGIEVYYYKDAENSSRTSASKALAQSVLTQVLSTTGAKSRGVKHGNYLVIRDSSVPAILVEGGFLTHPDELAKIKDPGYLKKLAWGVAQGIGEYAQSARRLAD